MGEITTRDRILDAAEQLFAVQGFEATSMRAITTAAGVNLASINYHFGSKDQLLREAVRRRIEPVNSERLRRLDDAIARADGRTPPVKDIVDAFVRPAVEEFARTDRGDIGGMLRVLYGEQIEPAFFRELFSEIFARFSVLQRAAPHLGESELVWRFHMMVGSMIHGMHCGGPSAFPSVEALEVDQIADMMVAWATAGFEAAACIDPRPNDASSDPSRAPTVDSEEFPA